MSLNIISTHEISVFSGKNGYHVSGLAPTFKYYGRLEAALKAIGWQEAFRVIMEELYPQFVDVVVNQFGKDRVKWGVQGLAGPHSSMTYPRYIGVEVTLTSFTDHQKSTTGTVETTVWPGNHAQAALRMLHYEVDAYCFKKGAFMDEMSLISFVRERSELIVNGMAKHEVTQRASEQVTDLDEEEAE